jgi:hypothetical protein
MESINLILHPDNNNKPISNTQQVLGLACGITTNIFSTSDIHNWTQASTEALTSSYNLIWKPRCSTANTAPSTGIKWDSNLKKKKNNNSNITNNNISSNNLNNNINTNNKKTQEVNSFSIVNTIDIPTLVTETFIQSNFNYSKCMLKLISNYHNVTFSNSE